jgi:hypothetical protein
MARALTAVAIALTLFIVGFGVVVFTTRDEDNVAIDNLLSERLTRAFQLADGNPEGDRVAVADFARFPWQRLLIVQRGTKLADVDLALGSPYKGIERWDTGPLLIFASGRKMVRYADYRGRGGFAGVRTPIAELSRAQAVFQVRDLRFRPVGGSA